MKRIEASAQAHFRVVARTARSQGAVMTLQAGETTGGPDNTHPHSDQWLFVVSGEGEATVGGRDVHLSPGTLLLIEAGEPHEVRNTGDSPLETLSVYAPPAY